MPQTAVRMAQQLPPLQRALGRPTYPRVGPFYTTKYTTVISLMPFEQLTPEQQQYIRDNDLYDIYQKAIQRGDINLFLDAQRMVGDVNSSIILESIKSYISSTEYKYLQSLYVEGIKSGDMTKFYERYNGIASQTPIQSSAAGWTGVIRGVDYNEWRPPGQPTIHPQPPIIPVDVKQLITESWNMLTKEQQNTIIKLGLRDTFNDAVLKNNPSIINDAINQKIIDMRQQQVEIGRQYGGGLSIVGMIARPGILGTLTSEVLSKLNLDIAIIMGAKPEDINKAYQDAYNAQENRFASQGTVIQGFNAALNSNDWRQVVGFMTPEIKLVETVYLTWLSSAGISYFATKVTPYISSVLKAKGITTIIGLRPMTWINIAVYGTLAAGITYVAVPQVIAINDVQNKLTALYKKYQQDIKLVATEEQRQSLELQYRVEKQNLESQRDNAIGNLIYIGFTTALALKYGFSGAKFGQALAGKPKVSITAEETPTTQKITAQKYIFGFRGRTYGRYGKTFTLERPTPYKPYDLGISKTGASSTTEMTLYKPPVYKSTEPVMSPKQAYYWRTLYTPKGVQWTGTPETPLLPKFTSTRETYLQYKPSPLTYDMTWQGKSYISPIKEETLLETIMNKELTYKNSFDIRIQQYNWQPKVNIPKEFSLSTKVWPKPVLYRTRTGKLILYEERLPLYAPLESGGMVGVMERIKQPYYPKRKGKTFTLKDIVKPIKIEGEVAPIQSQRQQTVLLQKQVQTKIQTTELKKLVQQVLKQILLKKLEQQRIQLKLKRLKLKLQQLQQQVQQQLQYKQQQEQVLLQQIRKIKLQIKQTEQQQEQVLILIQKLNQEQIRLQEKIRIQVPISLLSLAHISIQEKERIRIQEREQIKLNLPIYDLTTIQEPIPTETFLPEEESKELKNTLSSKSFNVYAKRDATKKAHWIKLNKQPQTYHSALGLGAKATDETVSRTFKITPTTGKSSNDYTLNWLGLQYKFRQPKSKKPGYYVEKTTYAIDTPGELEGITMKGWLAKRNKQKAPHAFKQSRRVGIKPSINFKPSGNMFKPQMVKL